MPSRSFNVLTASWLAACAATLAFATPANTQAAQATATATTAATTSGTSSTMSAVPATSGNLEANKQVALAYYAAYNQNVTGGSAAFFDQFIAPDMVDHTLPPNTPVLQTYKTSYTHTLQTFPDVRVDVNDLIAQRDEVVVRNTFYGTDKGALGSSPATNKLVIAGGVDILRIANGKIVEHWAQNDDLGLYQQLGLIPGTAANIPATPEATIAPAISATAADDSATVATNTAAAQAIVNAINSGTLSNFNSMAAASFVDHMPVAGGSGLGLMGTYVNYLTAFPDLKLKVEDTIAERDEVALRLTATGINKKPFMGFPATNMSMSFQIVAIYRFVGGKVSEAWHIEDQLGLGQQLQPPPPPTAAATMAPTAAATKSGY